MCLDVKLPYMHADRLGRGAEMDGNLGVGAILGTQAEDFPLVQQVKVQDRASNNNKKKSMIPS